MMASRSQRSWLLATLLTLNGGVTGFVRKSGAFHRPPSVAFRPLSALVFGPDGEKEEWDDWDQVEQELHVLEENHMPLGSSQVLSQEQIASLARMAAAFSPEGQELDLEYIQDIEILSVGHDQIEISAVVCETDGCITTRVPITFPTPCIVSDGMDKCITDNLGHLDVQAQGKLREMELKEENKEDDEYIWQTLTSTADMDLPTWWDPRPEMVQDCDNIRLLLNEEGFQTELRGVATKALMEVVDHREEFKVERTAVVAVCPSGLHMRALVKRPGVLNDDEYKFVEASFAFGKSAVDGDTLRNEVLTAVEAASAYVE